VVRPRPFSGWSQEEVLRPFGSAIGTPTHITDLCVVRQARYLRGMGAARALFERRAA
jgi:hypothetical protein